MVENATHSEVLQTLTKLFLREGCTKKKPEKVWSFAKPGGGGVSEGSKLPNLYFGVLKRVKNGQKTH